ncbi:N-acetylmuramoyl-L-alanine amidase [Clostridium aestuarii]|uniref:N-acetylmuramoyl-L-alanine amidase n=1 Tax=Clostridium aestuarii TaxID=338193 RepID=A0ABT4D3I8_9CLOT|nr:N-acetylmuramoyl-L-alanine amidase [Clostridium aestuarii]MCY6485811.1 N-acetylmuramoyl-L-alanine amidase [Clostridium aestuarii]
MKIFIDPGHGGRDPGAVDNGLYEKYLTLDISLKQKKLFEKLGHQVKLSRNTDKYISLSERTREANRWGADIFISNHINAGGGNGTEVWHSINGGKGKQYATNIEKNLSKIFKSRGIKSRRGRYGDYLYVIRATNMPAVLNEFGFIDNISDAKKLKREDIKQKCAEAVVYGILGQRIPNDEQTISKVVPKVAPKVAPNLQRLLRYSLPMLRGEDVKLLQKKLNQLGFNTGVADGVFGRKTESAVKEYQKDNRLVIDGIVGENTWGRLVS